MLRPICAMRQRHALRHALRKLEGRELRGGLRQCHDGGPCPRKRRRWRVRLRACIRSVALVAHQCRCGVLDRGRRRLGGRSFVGFVGFVRLGGRGLGLHRL